MQNEPGERDAIWNTSPLPGRAQIKGIVMVREDGGSIVYWMRARLNRYDALHLKD